MGAERTSQRLRLSPRLIDELPVRERRYEIADATTPAVKVRVTRNGAKTLSVVYRSPVTRKKSRVSLGRWPTAQGTDKAAYLRQLRVEAAQVLAEVARGEDPALLRRESKRARRERDRVEYEASRSEERRARTFGSVAVIACEQPDSSAQVRPAAPTLVREPLATSPRGSSMQRGLEGRQRSGRRSRSSRETSTRSY